MSFKQINTERLNEAQKTDESIKALESILRKEIGKKRDKTDAMFTLADQLSGLGMFFWLLKIKHKDFYFGDDKFETRPSIKISREDQPFSIKSIFQAVDLGLKRINLKVRRILLFRSQIILSSIRKRKLILFTENGEFVVLNLRKAKERYWLEKTGDFLFQIQVKFSNQNKFWLFLKKKRENFKRLLKTFIPKQEMWRQRSKELWAIQSIVRIMAKKKLSLLNLKDQLVIFDGISNSSTRYLFLFFLIEILLYKSMDALK